MSLTLRPSRKRDRLRSIFGRSPSPLPTNPIAGPAQIPSSNLANTSIGSGILADALEALEHGDRATVSTLLLPTNAISIDAAFDEVYTCAKELQQRCKIKRWSWNYRGRQLYLFEQVDKVVQLLDKFKAVGDIIANVDPVHVGLPWAGVRAILEVAMADSNQRAVLVTGTELALYVSNRLKVYLDTFACLSPSPAKNNLRKSLVSLYAHILEFLAHAIGVQQKKGTVRVWQALWDSGALTQFEDKCDKLCVRASEEARICDGRAGLEAQLRTLHEIHKVHASVMRLEHKVDLGKLETAKDATYNSFTEGELSRCLPDTRLDLLEQIFDWAADYAGKRIFWLCGKAGTGKSTISRTVAHQFDDDGLLGASFFFKRGRADRSHAKLLFPTIARQLADLFPDIAHAIAVALDQDSLLCDKYLKTQFDNLLLKPLQNVNQDSFPSASIILVIDALDECDNGESVKTMLLLLSRVEAITSVRLRIFVTSRPELPVELGFKGMSGDLHQDVRLEEAQETSIAHDIQVFYEHQFSEIRDASLLQVDELPAKWPGDENIGLLVDKAAPLFIFAFTVSRYIAANPKRNLNTILQQNPGEALPGIKGTYIPILNSVVVSEGDGDNQDRVLDFKRIAGSLVLLYDPLGASALARLLGLCAGDVDRVLRPLHSVLNIPRASDGKMDCTTPITLFHLSFRDFLVDPALKSENTFWINAEETHWTLANHCIRLLESGGLKEDMCEVVAPGTRRSEVAKSTVHSYLPEVVAYACCYWTHHLVSSGKRIKDNDVVLPFLQKHMLHWMEALSWLGKASDVIHNTAALRSLVHHDEGKQLSSMLDDASRFALRNRYIIDEAPLQIYMSALLFAPSMSTVRHIFGNGLQRYCKLMPSVTERWGAERQKLEGHDDYVTAVAFSPDGKTVASGSRDNTVRLWDAATGEERQKLEGHDYFVTAVVFSPDGKTVASGSRDKTARLWDAATGEQRQKLEGHDEWVTAVVFSPDGKRVASGSHDKIVRLWDATTGEQRQKLEGHDDRITAVAFSPDGKTVASGSHDRIVRLWDATTGEERQKLGGHDYYVTAVAFSPDGKMMASGSRDKTIRLWDVVTGEERQKFEGHGLEITAVAFSPDGKTVVSGSSDKTVRLWDAATGEQRQKLVGHDERVTAVVFSPDSKTVASGSRDKTVRLWDAATDDERQKLVGHDYGVTAVAFSPDGETVASGSHDSTIGLWDAATGEERRKLKGHDYGVTAVAFSPDGKTVVSGSRDKTVRLWDAATGEERHKFEGHDSWVTAVAFSPDGKMVVSGSGDKTARLWDPAMGEKRQKHQTSRVISGIRFFYDRRSLETNTGQLDLGIILAAHPAPINEIQSVLLLEASWIKRCGLDFLWLPHEYRGVCYDAHGSHLVIGQLSGAVSFFSFK